jgi:acyl-[acyl-carrier-protein]-phospholipid O-acyltransferase / long-chain-fatty-acid--[acyl-carrier-protein] ligase
MNETTECAPAFAAALERDPTPPTRVAAPAGTWCYRWARGWLRLILRGGFGVRFERWERLPAEGGVLLFGNHLSYTDALLLAAASPRPVRFLGHAKLCRQAWLRFVFRLFGVIPVTPGQSLDALRRASGALRAGEVVAIFPEGAISLAGDLLAFQKGFLSIARQGQAPMVAFSFSYDLQARWPLGFRWLGQRAPKLRSPRRARLSLGKPLNPFRTTMNDALEAVYDAGHEAFKRRPELDAHLAALAVRDLKSHPFHRHVVDLATGRKELKSGMLLAVALTMAEAWRDRLPEDRVGVVFPSGLGSILSNLAVTLLGKTPVNLNFTAGASINRKCLAKAGVRTVITAAPVIQKLPEFPWPEQVIDLVQERAQLKKSTILKNFAKVLCLPTGMLLRHFGVPERGGEREAAILFSSGSTGDPKGVVLTHRNIVANCLQIQECRLLEKHERMLACLPTFHSFGFTVTLWYPLLTGLQCVCLPSPLETKRLAEAVRDEKVTVMMGTPTFYRPYFKRVPKEWLRSLRFVVGGAEKTPPGFHDRWEAHFGSQYLEGYGLTETSPVLSCNLPTQGPEGQPNKRVGTVGRLFPGLRARVTDPSTGAVLPIGASGVLEVRGPNIFAGYLDDAEATAKVFRDGWFVTGDLAKLEADGFMTIEGRLSRFSKIGGEMVPHGTIEQEIVRAFELEDSEAPLVAVTGVSDDQKGESLVLLAAVEIRLDELRHRLSGVGLPNLWIPRRIKRVDGIPCLASGKLDLRALARLAEGLD